MTTVEPTYKVSENNPGEWIITKASDPSFLWSEQGWVRIDDGVCITNFSSEADALTYAQQRPSLHVPKDDITAPWRDWPTEHLLRKIEMPEGFVAELRKRLGAATTLAKWCDEHGTENIPTSLIGEIIEIIAANPLRDLSI
jgi:hypothetical protein